MKFLLDRCAGRRLADWLREAGHDVSESRLRGPDPGDAELLAWAAAEDRVLVTLDKDFGQLVFTGNALHRGIIRLPDVPAARRIELVRQILAEIPAADIASMVVTVRGDRIRVSRLPRIGG